MTRSPDLMSWAETAVVLGCSVRTLQRLKTTGQIGYVLRGSAVYFMPDDVAAYIESQHILPTAAGRSGRKRKAS